MNKTGGETSPLVLARSAGLVSLAILIAGTFAGQVSASLIVPGDSAATIDNIGASLSFFKLGMVSGLAMYTLFVFYVLLLYRLLTPVDRHQSLAMLVLALTGVPIAMLNQINQAAVLLLLGDNEYSRSLTSGEIQAQVMFFLDLHRQGGLVGIIFWGLWLLPLGYLVFRSGFFPRILGIMLMIGCFGWLAVFVQRMFLPDYAWLAYARYAAHIAELAWLVWLLIMGVNVEQWQSRRASGID